LIARTDARATAGLDEAMRRARLYDRAGADMIFLEAPQSVAELKTISRKLADVPLLVNMVEGGKTPTLPFEDFEEMGFKIVLYPTSSIRAVAKTLQECAAHLYSHKNTKDFEGRLVSFEGRNQITGLSLIKKLEEKFGPLS
jgi:methylisocitrate lyase